MGRPQADIKRGRDRWIKILLPAVIALVVIRVFSPEAPPVTDKPFNIKDCLASVPEDITGLKVLEGSRTETSIIRDMVPIVCRARKIFEGMRAEEGTFKAGSMTLRVSVEFNGEVIQVKIEESDITDRQFQNKIVNLVVVSDFAYQGREDTDSVFLYPIHFR